MGFLIRVSKGVPANVEKIVREVFRRLNDEAVQTIPVFIVNKSRIDKTALGIFGYKIYPKSLVRKYPFLQDMRYPYISIAGIRINERSVIKTCFHEFAHYEQFRDGKKIQERGVKVRTRSLIKKYIA